MPRPFCSAPADAPSREGMDSGRPAAAATTDAATSTDAASGFLQQLHQRMRARCCPGASPGSSVCESGCAASHDAATASVHAVGLALPCLLQSWRRRIERMVPDSDAPRAPDQHHRTRLHRHETPHQDRHRHRHRPHAHRHDSRPTHCHRPQRGDRSVERAADASLSPPESTASSSASASPSSTAATDAGSSPPPPSTPSLCRFAGFELPKLLHPRLERQRACASLSGLWGSPETSPRPSPDAEDASRPWRPRCHPYWRSGGGGGGCSSSK